MMMMMMMKIKMIMKDDDRGDDDDDDDVGWNGDDRSEEHTSEFQSRLHLVCRLLLEKKNNTEAPVIRRWHDFS